MGVDRGAYQSKEQDQEHFKELDRKELLEVLERKELLEELDRKGTYPFEVDRGAYQSKKQDDYNYLDNCVVLNVLM